MANVILDRFKPNNNNNTPANIAQMQAMGPSNMVFSNMYRTNPAFRKFADSMQGKTPEQAFRENGLNFNDYKKYRW